MVGYTSISYSIRSSDPLYNALNNFARSPVYSKILDENQFNSNSLLNYSEALKNFRNSQVITPLSVEENLGNLIINSPKYLKTIESVKPEVRQYYFKSIMLDVCSILQQLHQYNIVHTNLKESNVVFDNCMKISLSDPCLNLLRNKQGKITSNCRYFSPEILCGGSITTKTDMWGLGVLMYSFLTGNYPFDGQTPNEIARKILNGSFDLGCVNSNYHSLICGLLKQNPIERYEITTVINILNDIHIGNEKNLNEMTENDFLTIIPIHLKNYNNDEYIISRIYHSQSQIHRIKIVRDLYSLTHQMRFIHLLLDKSLYNNNEIIELDLSGLGITDNCFLSIIDQLKNLEHIKKLDISCNELSDNSLRQLSSDIGYLKHLNFLDLSCNNFTSSEVINLLTNMDELELVKMNGIRILSQHFELILRNIPINDNGLIDLSNCNLSDEHLYILYNHKHMLNDVYGLDLSENSFGLEGIRILLEVKFETSIRLNLIESVPDELVNDIIDDDDIDV